MALFVSAGEDVAGVPAGVGQPDVQHADPISPSAGLSIVDSTPGTATTAGGGWRPPLRRAEIHGHRPAGRAPPATSASAPSRHRLPSLICSLVSIITIAVDREDELPTPEPVSAPAHCRRHHTAAHAPPPAEGEEGERTREKGEREEEEGRTDIWAPHVSGPTFLFV